MWDALALPPADKNHMNQSLLCLYIRQTWFVFERDILKTVLCLSAGSVLSCASLLLPDTAIGAADLSMSIVRGPLPHFSSWRTVDNLRYPPAGSICLSPRCGIRIEQSVATKLSTTRFQSPTGLISVIFPDMETFSEKFRRGEGQGGAYAAYGNIFALDAHLIL